MERCLDCNGVMSREEKVCLTCGTKVGAEGSNIAALISCIVSILFYISIAALVTSPFISRGPSFIFCLFMSSALLFAMRTAKDSVKKVRKR
jgi:hypothetical protein